MVTKASQNILQGLQDTGSERATATETSVPANKPTSTMSDHSPALDNPRKRTRKTHSKVRTGCLTCKIRKKKCDETKPACVRCTSTGRKCDGYATQSPSPAAKKSLSNALENVIWPSGSTTLQNPSYTSSSTQTPCCQNKRTRHMLPAVTPVVKSILPKEKHSSDDQTPVDYTPELDRFSTSPPGSDTFTDSTYASLDHESEKSEEEELDDFILSYRKPVSSVNVNAAVVAPTKEIPTVQIATISNRSVTSHQQPLAQIIFEKPSISRSLFPYGGQVSEIERHCFTFFRYRTGPSFSSYFDSSMWRSYAVSAALAHPVVLSCAAACGAAHRRWGFGISREAFEYCAHADRLHKKAVRGLEDLKREFEENPSSMGTYDRDVIMTSEMLLGLFQGFQGEYHKTVVHMHNGIKYLLGRPMTLVHSESRYCAIASKAKMFCQLFDQLDCRAMQLLRSPTNLLVKYGQGDLLPPVPKVFRNLEDARDLIFTEVDWIMNAPARVWQDMHQRSDIQDLHVRRLLNWSVAYANTTQNLERTPQEKKACLLLKVVRNAAYMLLYLTLFVTAGPEVLQLPDFDTELGYEDPEQEGCLAFATKKLWETVDRKEELSINLERIKLAVESILDDNGTFNYDEHSVSFDSAIGPPRYATAERLVVPEESEKTRHLVKRLMQRKTGDSSLWEMLGVYGVAERISAVEEHAVMDAVRGIVPQAVDPKWVDVTCLMESRRILLKYCRPDDYGLGMMWTQEWWAF